MFLKEATQEKGMNKLQNNSLLYLILQAPRVNFPDHEVLGPSNIGSV